jgi:CubicO group peptidase (beta-lactamase class C family)
MKTIFKRLFLFAVIVTVLSSCKKDESETLCDPTPQLDIDLFIENVEAALTEDPYKAVAGYQLAVVRNGNLYDTVAGGMSVYGSDPGGPLKMTPMTRLNVASVSKFIGTIALMQVLEKHEIDVSENIREYLPARWKDALHEDYYGPGAPFPLTFERMLQMRTAIPFGDNDPTNSPGPMLTTGEMFRDIAEPAISTRNNTYQNGNFTLIRVLITELEYGLDAADPNYNFMTTEAYFDYIKREIFDKLGIDAPMSVSAVNNYYDNTNFTRAHQYPFFSVFRDEDNNVGWAATSDPTLNGGSGGLVLNSLDLAKVLAYFIHDDGTIISKDQRETILAKNLGLWGTGSGDHGKYSSKGGTRGPDDDGRAIQSMVMMFPGGIEAVLLVNSNKDDLGATLRKAFDEAWVSPC